MAEDPRIEQIRAVLANHTDPFSIYGHQGRGLERIRAIVNGAPPAPGVLGPEHTYALSVARSAVLKAAGKFVIAADRYRKRDLLRSVQEMADSERACVRVASFLADEIASARASEERAIPEPPPPRAEPGEWVFRGYDQLGQDVWSWRAIPEPTEGQNP